MSVRVLMCCSASVHGCTLQQISLPSVKPPTSMHSTEKVDSIRHLYSQDAKDTTMLTLSGVICVVFAVDVAYHVNVNVNANDDDVADDDGYKYSQQTPATVVLIALAALYYTHCTVCIRCSPCPSRQSTDGEEHPWQ
jgi:hypothetical protein